MHKHYAFKEVVRFGRRHLFSDDVIIEDIVIETGCDFAQARKFLRKYDETKLLKTVFQGE